MRLVKTGSTRHTSTGRDAFEQLRDAGDRLEHVVARYGRLVTQLAQSGPASDMQDTIELMNSQLAYVAKRLQELVLAQHEEQLDEQASRRYGRAVV